MSSKLHILIVLLLTLLLVPTSASAQRLRLQVKYEKKQGKKKDVLPAQRVRVWLYLRENDVNNACNKGLEGRNLVDNKYLYSDITDGNGVAILTNKIGTTDVFFLLDASILGAEKLIIVNVKKQLHPKLDQENMTYDMEYVIPSNLLATDLGEVYGEGISTFRPTGGTVTAYRNGDEIQFEVDEWIDSVYARRDARFGFAPCLVVPAENYDTVGLFAPHVVDGADYERTMVRRMDGNLANDGLQPYKETEVLIYNRDRNVQIGVSNNMPHHKWGRFSYTQKAKVDTSKHYNCYALSWFEDYNTVYHRNIKKVWNGYYVDLNRFLDWKNVHADIEIDSVRYRRREEPGASQSGENYHLQFDNGRHTLKMNDSTTVVELDRLRRNIQRITSPNDQSQIIALEVHGYASPDGSEQGNKSLSERRAAHVASLLKQYSNNQLPEPKSVGDVVPWEEVADTLQMRGDSLSLRAAEQIREICKTTPGLKAQSDRIKQLPVYAPYILNQILPCMRRVNITYTTVVFKILSQDEIYERYCTNETYRSGDATLHQNDYYNLMNRLYEEEDYEGLERIAKRAMDYSELKEKVFRVDADSIWKDWKTDTTYQWKWTLAKKDSVIYERAYPLAAYYLAKCYLKRGKVDLKLLDNYIDFSFGRNQGRAHLKTDFDGQEYGWWNEPAILLSQIEMQCLAGRYEDAEKTLYVHFADGDPRVRRFSYFIRALQNDYQNKEVRDTVAVSSPMNFLVAWFGYAKKTGDKKGYQTALSLIDGNYDAIEDMGGAYTDLRERWGDAKLDSLDSRVMYMKALCYYYGKLTPELWDLNRTALIGSSYINPDGDDPYVYPMLQACLMDENNVRLLQKEGLVNDPYRTLVLFFYNRMKAGATFEQARREYDKLNAKYSSVSSGQGQ